MPSSAELLLDTSVSVPFLLRSHPAHSAVHDAVRGRRLGLSGHAALETFSVVTRLPEPQRVSPAVAEQLIRRNFPHTVHLSARRTQALLTTLATNDVSGGATWDALVGAAAVEHSGTLVTRDQRAVRTYRQLGVEILLLA